jgi:hypothetical protein
LPETLEPHWKKTNVLIVKKRDTGKLNDQEKRRGSKRSSNWSDGAGAPCHHPSLQSPRLPFNWGANQSNSNVILVWPIQFLKNQRVPYLKKNCLFRGPQELNKTTTGQKAELLT